MRPVLSHGGEAAATIPAMNAALRTTLGWVAAVLLNLGAVLFVVGLIVPRSGDVSVLEIGIAMLVVGLLVGAVWLFGSRGARRR